jgi:hypothetical protein
MLTLPTFSLRALSVHHQHHCDIGIHGNAATRTELALRNVPPLVADFYSHTQHPACGLGLNIAQRGTK